MFLQVLGNVCVGLAAVVYLLPLQRLLSRYANTHVNDDRWVKPALVVLSPLWLLLMGGLLCMTAGGGFDWLQRSRGVLYGFAIAAALGLALVSFVFLGLFVRPGFTPRGLYLPAIQLVPLSTMLLLVSSLNRQLAPGAPWPWLRLPWAIFAAVGFVAGVAFFGKRIVRMSVVGTLGFAQRIAKFGSSSRETVARLSEFDPETDFERILWLATRHQGPVVHAAATARLRSHPTFVERLAAELTDGHVEPAVAFLRDATLSPEERDRLAGPALRAMERWVNRIPAPNYTTKKHLSELRRWGTSIFRSLTETFAGTGVDFAPLMGEFREKVEPVR
ncbi:MAG: hypothetical protein AB7I19_10250 [Planctomycetota bacterium]